jgi:hypothetical protein
MRGQAGGNSPRSGPLRSAGRDKFYSQAILYQSLPMLPFLDAKAYSNHAFVIEGQMVQAQKWWKCMGVLMAR